jgi:hypothetical protein
MFYTLVSSISVILMFIATLIIAIREEEVPMWARILLPLLSFPMVLAVLDSLINSNP